MRRPPHRWLSLRRVLLATSALAPLGLLPAAPALANPQGGQVVGGNAQIQGQGTASVTVTQSTDRAIINWHTFNVGTGERVQFVQPGASSVALNRVTGGLGPSTIAGTIAANGRVFLVNPDGILFGAGAIVDTAGFLATTHDIKNDDFMAGRFDFTIPGRADASVVNLGTITAHSSGFAALVAPGVRNAGTISARLGKVALASATGFSLDFYGDSLITLAVDDRIAAEVKDVATGQKLDALVKNEGKLRANGGVVQLSAVTARAVVDSVINNSGVIEARTVGTRNGKIVLGAPTAGTKLAGASTQTVRLSGKLDVSGRRAGQTGGTVQVTGENIEVVNATVDATGRAGGGRVLIGGDTGGGHSHWAVGQIAKAALETAPVATASTVSVDVWSTIDASAKDAGDGGKVIVWADGTTTYGGTILAKGGAGGGDGGFVEVSGHQSLSYYGLVNTSAVAGRNGTLLLDPVNAYIDVNAGPGVITVAAVQAALANGDLIVTTGYAGDQPGDLTVAAPITWSTGNALGLLAHRNIHVNANVTSTGGGEVALLADQEGTGTGTVTFGTGVQISTSGEVNIAYNPTSYTSPTDYSPFVTGGPPYKLTAYMLVNTPQNLQDIETNLAGNYVLGRDIDMTGFSFTPLATINPYTGKFAGLGHSIENLTIAAGALDQYVGLFGQIGSTAIVEDITFRNATVSWTTGYGAKVGVLAGVNHGEVMDVVVEDSTVAVNGMTGEIGGLIGRNEGIVYSTKVEVDVHGGHYNKVGGLVGHNAGGSIYKSLATGDVTAGNGDVGGLVGRNTSIIFDSGAIGSVDVSSQIYPQVYAGGLVGYNDTTGMLSRVFARGDVTGSSSASPASLGGLAGYSAGTINQAYATGDVNGHSIAYAGGLIGETGSGATTQSVFAAGAVAGAGGYTGGVVGYNAATLFDAYWNTTAFGGSGVGTNSPIAGSTAGVTASQLQANLPYGLPGSTWTYTPGYNNGFPHLTFETEPVNPGFPFNFPTILMSTPTGSLDITQDVLTAILIEMIIKHILEQATPQERQEIVQALIEIVQPQGGPPGPGGQSGDGPGSGPGARGAINPATGMPPQPLRPIAGPDGERFSSIPPIGETRFLNNEVVVQVPAGVSPEQVAQIAQKLGLSVITSQDLGALGRRAYRFNLPPGGNVRDMILALEANSIIAVAQPNYRFRLGQAPAPASAPSDAPELTQRGDPSQYMMGKLHLGEAHRIADGRNILVAVIDSEIDRNHSELKDVIVQRFAASGGQEPAHSHGTAMAGAIASRDRLLGVAPSAKILAIRAFSEANNTAESTTYSILKSIDWAVAQGARVINMSFAGPADPSLHRTLKAAAEKGVVLIAAAGNAGPKSPPLYPGADPNVIAVTATDASDRLFRMANRGPHLSVAAPGVDILAPAPEAAYQMSTGTSIATAHVTGVVALMLEKDPSLTPAEVRRILETTAQDLGPKGKDPQFGWGLVDPRRALHAVLLREAARKRQQTQ